MSTAAGVGGARAGGAGAGVLLHEGERLLDVEVLGVRVGPRAGGGHQASGRVSGAASGAAPGVPFAGAAPVTAASSAQRPARAAALRAGLGDGLEARALPGPPGRTRTEEGGQRDGRPGHPVGGVAREIEQDPGVDVQVDAQLVLGCGNPFIQHVTMLPDACLAEAMSSQVSQSKEGDGVRDAGEAQSAGQAAQRQAR